MTDYGEAATDRLTAELEKRIAQEYAQAVAELQDKLDEYFRLFDVKDQAWQRMVADGKKSMQEYQAWRQQQMMVGTKWMTLREELAEDLHNANINARGIVNDNLAEIYAENHNFTTYSIERAAGVDTSYTLYEKDAVARILRDNPELLPPPGAEMNKTFSDFDRYKAGLPVDLTDEQRKVFDNILKNGKDIRWQEGKIQSITLQSILQGESLPNMTKRIARELGEINHKATIRYARTATTGAQNAGKEDAYRRAADHGCKLKRVWRAVYDQRTRHEHRVLDGQVRGIDEPFEVDGYKINFPGDPAIAREAPHLYWNCRCGTRALIDGLEPQAIKYRQNDIDGMTYEEWKNAKPKSQSITHQEEMAEAMRRRAIRDIYGGKGGSDGSKGGNGTVTEPKSSFAKKVDAIRKELKNGGDFEDCVKRAGKLMADEYAKHASDVKKADDIIRKQINDIRAKQDAMNNEWWDLFTQKADPDRRNAIQKAIDALNDEIRKLNGQLLGGVQSEADWLKDKLGEVRSVGIGNNDIKAHFRNGRSPMIGVLERAYGHYPTDWVDASVAHGTLKAGKVSRGYYNKWLHEIMISGDPKSNHAFETAIHELGHRFEDVFKDIVRSEKRFYDRRTAGEQLVWLGQGYRQDEKTRRDKFLHAYMGKEYGFDAYELVSMGFEYAYTHPQLLANDPDMQRWIYGLLMLV